MYPTIEPLSTKTYYWCSRHYNHNQIACLWMQNPLVLALTKTTPSVLNNNLQSDALSHPLNREDHRSSWLKIHSLLHSSQASWKWFTGDFPNLSWTNKYFSCSHPFFHVSVSNFKVHTASFCLDVLMSINSQRIKCIKYTNEHFKTKETIKRMKPMMDHLVNPELINQWQQDEMVQPKQHMACCNTIEGLTVVEVKAKMYPASVASSCQQFAGQEQRWQNE